VCVTSYTAVGLSLLPRVVVPGILLTAVQKAVGKPVAMAVPTGEENKRAVQP
jgi:hypothetical protein